MATVNTYIQSLYGGLAELANLTYIIKCIGCLSDYGGASFFVIYLTCFDSFPYPTSLEGLLVLYGNIDHLTIGA